jgi:hypothetical protein|uniref:Uncharacterized protein n=1 Tax=Picea glauca TaxID=3330 RepID=A0A101LY82_PICGL|nr:hypothetical protein ABT39_MTgene5755 [Picea glauca]QHR87680.1 hypothetical protein Q903MT_gene1692 [Picea sitchensis]
MNCLLQTDQLLIPLPLNLRLKTLPLGLGKKNLLRVMLPSLTLLPMLLYHSLVLTQVPGEGKLEP